MVFEDYSLYPHMTAFENIAFPLRVRRTPAAEVKRKVGEAIELLGLQSVADVAVRTLSGGAQQRVSIGRALVRDPALVMFDEPLSHLDADQKVMLRTEIRRLQSSAGLTSVLVTHDQTEAMAMADRIAVMNHGVLQQIGSPRELYGDPANLFVAAFIGESPMNFFPAGIDPASGLLRLDDAPQDGAPVVLPPSAGRPTALTLGIRPEDIRLQPRDGEAALRLGAQVVDRECCGDRDVLLLVNREGKAERRFNVEVPSPAAVRAGDTVTCHLPIDRLHGFDAKTGVSLKLRGAAC
jgi:ABC-type sugar transport system ATPase subunit